MKVSLLTEQDWPEWDRFIKAHPNSSLYHTLEWKNILEATFGYKARFLVVSSGPNIIDVLPLFLVTLLGLGKKLICIPQSGSYSAFLSDNIIAHNLLVEAAVKMAKTEGVKYLEIRSNAPSNELIQHNFLERHPFYFPHLELLDVSTNKKLLSNAHKRNVAKAKKNGVVVELSQNKSDLKTFYSMLEEMYRDYGTPIYKYSYING